MKNAFVHPNNVLAVRDLFASAQLSLTNTSNILYHARKENVEIVFLNSYCKVDLVFR